MHQCLFENIPFLGSALRDHIALALPYNLQAKVFGTNVTKWQITFEQNKDPILTIQYKE